MPANTIQLRGLLSRPPRPSCPLQTHPHAEPCCRFAPPFAVSPRINTCGGFYTVESRRHRRENRQHQTSRNATRCDSVTYPLASGPTRASRSRRHSQAARYWCLHGRGGAQLRPRPSAGRRGGGALTRPTVDVKKAAPRGTAFSVAIDPRGIKSRGNIARCRRSRAWSRWRA